MIQRNPEAVLESMAEKVNRNIETMYEIGNGSLARAVHYALKKGNGAATRSFPLVQVVATYNRDGTYQRNFRPGNDAGQTEGVLELSVDARNKLIRVENCSVPKNVEDLARMTHAVFNIRYDHQIQ